MQVKNITDPIPTISAAMMPIILSSIKRAGADFIVTYLAKSGAKIISDSS